MRSVPVAVVVACILAVAGASAFADASAAPRSPAQAILTQSRAAYAALTSYADTGSVVYEFGPASAPTRERHTFRTAYRGPRQFLFDFTKEGGPAAGRLVVWGDGDAFHSWWSVTGVQDTYARGQGATAFVVTTSPTYGSVVMIAPLLFQGAGLVGTLEEFDDPRVEGTEVVDGRTCHKLVGIARSQYGTGHETNVRRTTVWIDTETLLVRKVFEDTPRGTPAGSGARRTTTFVPQADPTLDDNLFRFVPPSSQ